MWRVCVMALLLMSFSSERGLSLRTQSDLLPSLLSLIFMILSLHVSMAGRQNRSTEDCSNFKVRKIFVADKLLHLPPDSSFLPSIERVRLILNWLFSILQLPVLYNHIYWAEYPPFTLPYLHLWCKLVTILYDSSNNVSHTKQRIGICNVCVTYDIQYRLPYLSTLKSKLYNIADNILKCGTNVLQFILLVVFLFLRIDVKIIQTETST